MPRPYLPDGVDALVYIEWGRAEKWDIRFDSAPAPFNTWFPATGCTFAHRSSSSMQFSNGIVTTSIPGGVDPLTVYLEWPNDDKDALVDWLTRWYDQVYNNGLSVLTVKEASRRLTILSLDNQDQEAQRYDLMVIPEGELHREFQSKAGRRVSTQNFIITGRFNSGARSLPSDTTTNVVTPSSLSGTNSTDSIISS